MKQNGPVGCVGLALLLSACGGSPPSSPTTSATPGALPSPGTSAPRTPSAAPGQPPAAEPQLATAVTGKDEMSAPRVRPEAKYDPGGRRDPFDLPDAIEGSVGTTVASAKLTGIIRTATGRVLVLIETPDGLGFILQPGDAFGDGRLVEVGQGTVVFTVVSRQAATNHRVVLKLGG